MRCLYVDLDGTLLGPGGALLADGEGAFSLLGARALEACARAGVEVVVVTGRRRDGRDRGRRLLGERSYIFEIGAGLVLDGEAQWLTGADPRRRVTIHEQIATPARRALLLERFAAARGPRAVAHGREVSHLLRGLVDVEEANALLAAHGHDDLRLLDNGDVRRARPRSPALPGSTPTTCVRAGLEGGRRRRAHAGARLRPGGLRRGRRLARGPRRAPSTLGTFWLVANASSRPAIAQASRARRTCASPRRGTARASTRRSSRRWRNAAEPWSDPQINSASVAAAASISARSWASKMRWMSSRRAPNASSRFVPTIAKHGTPAWRARVAASPAILPCSVCSSMRPSPTITARAARIRAS